LRKKNEKVAGVFLLPPYFYEISEKFQITQITNTLKNKEKSVESFFEIPACRQAGVQSECEKFLFQSTLYRGRRE